MNPKKILFLVAMFSGLFPEAQILLPETRISLPAAMAETSGMEWMNDSIWVTHNDSGNDAILYFLNRKGEIRQKFKLKNTPNIDWEDVAFDGKGNLYIADLGNNMNDRKNLKVHGFGIHDSTEWSFVVSYADQKFPVSEANRNFDSEAMIFYKENLYTFTKNNTTPYNGVCKMYKINLTDSVQNLTPFDSLVLGDEGYWKNSVTAADISDDMGKVVLLTYKYLYFFIDFTDDGFLKGKYMRFLLPEIQQREAVAFDDHNNIWVTDENSRLKNGGYLYFYNMEKIYSGDFFYRDPEIGIVSLKTQKTKEEGIRLLQIQGEVTRGGDYLLEFLKNGKVMHSVVKTANGKIKEEIKFLPDDTYTEIFSVRIYKDNQLVYANKIDPFK